MSKYQIVRELRREIKKLNRQIDLNIIRGVSYREESRRHKFLVSQLQNLLARGKPVLSVFGFGRILSL